MDSIISYDHEYYLRNKGSIISSMRARAEEIRIILQDYRSVPCTDCGIAHPWWAMEFDHVGIKSTNVAEMVRHPTHWSNSKILNELSRCEVVCIGCHRDRTQTRLVSTSIEKKRRTQRPGDRTCNKCRQSLHDTEFYLSRGRPRPTCILCWKEITTSARKAATRAIVHEHKAKPCVDCGQQLPYWKMDFDHLPDTDKICTVSRLASMAVSRKKILTEIAKCEVVCCFCHRDRTHYRSLEAKCVEREWPL